MALKPDAPLDDHALSVATDFYAALPDLPHGDYFDHIPLHWSGGAYGCTDSAYNGEVILKDDQWLPVITHDPLDNAVDIEDGPYAPHTLGRNSHGFGLAIAGMRDATSSDFGDQQLQEHQLAVLEAAAGAVALKYGIQAGDGRAVYTHAECAEWDGYGPQRWDLGRLAPSDAPLTPQERSATGNFLRHRIHAYKARLALILNISV